MLDVIKHKRLAHERLDAFRHSIDSGRAYLPPNLSRFVFLCGANKSKDEISERRKALMEFADANLPHTHFFLAEKMFRTLKEEGHKGNLLDVEQLVSDFSDCVLIVLESPSSFAELGAFSNDILRKKLVVINDEKFKYSESFINLGPIAAIEEATGPERIVYYNMSHSGVTRRDTIGDTFFQIHELFKDPIAGRAKSIRLAQLHPGDNFDKFAAMFLHDIIFLLGPLAHKEVIAVLIRVFGKANFNQVSHLLAILCAFNSLERNDAGLYRSRKNQCYYKYRFDLDSLVAVFRNFVQKDYPERLYAY